MGLERLAVRTTLSKDEKTKQNIITVEFYTKGSPISSTLAVFLLSSKVPTGSEYHIVYSYKK